MNELLQSFIEDPSAEESKATAFPAANSTSAFQISAGYMHVIVAIYAIVVVLVILIIIMIVVQSIRKSWKKKKDGSGYGAIPRHDRQNRIRQRVDELDPDVEILDGNNRTYGLPQDDDSEYDNVSLNLGRRDHGDTGADSPPLYEDPPSYLSINR
ncbi:hypothetical protein HNY73_000876 [Argiope bruennichi]|uniref:Uncharacterized protein n=1 Tax=Argiope bruennichi TaxID=94029 RepID=A0A8T0G3S7_ARGBR|nr:hypothetical protein HNY73_000876 [Argiope bruennichi]